jgi:hypothetical protein
MILNNKKNKAVRRFSYSKESNMSKPVSGGQVVLGILLWGLTALPLALIGLFFFLWQGKGIERYVGSALPLAIAFGITQSIVRKFSGK